MDDTRIGSHVIDAPYFFLGFGTASATNGMAIEVRHELGNLEALNFLLEGALGGGGTTSLLVDPQGKTMSQALLQMKVKVPAGLLRGL